MRKKITYLAVMAVCLLRVGIASAESWDLYKDMSFTANPNGPWSYGVLAPFDYANPKLLPNTKTLKLFGKVFNLNASVSKWAMSRLTSDIPGLTRHSDMNDLHPGSGGTDSNNYAWIHRGWVAMEPGLQGWKDPNFSEDLPAIVRWTSPIAGAVYVSGIFGKGVEVPYSTYNVVNNSNGYFIIVNNSLVKLAIQNAYYDIPFKFDTSVKAGDTIDFVVTQGTDGSGADMTPVAVRIDTAPLPDDDVLLSSLDVSNICSAGIGNKKITPDRNIYGQPLSIGGKVFENGCGMLAHGIIYVDLNKSVGRFSCYVGVDDAGTEPNVAVKFRVLGDGRELYNSGIMKRGDAPKAVDVNIADINQMVLVALPRGVPKHGDCSSYSIGDGSAADWADAKFQRVKEMPRIVLPPMEEPYILTPPAPAKPRINGPKVYGVRPGNPVFFTIPTTGLRPIKFAVQNMPKGLSVDEASGIITGSIEKEGQYPVMLIAENAHGKDQRKFRFIVGDMLALTPYMGWNSWYVYLDDVNDKKIRQAADAMVKSGMINYGYTYVNIAEAWMMKPASDDPLLLDGVADVKDMQRRIDGYKFKPKCDYAYIPNPRDCNGMINSNEKFPDMKGLADYVHGLGLKIGLYSSPGTLTCAGNIGSFRHEDKDAERYAQWGFDYLMYDLCNYVSPDYASKSEMQKPFRIMGEALQRQKRDIVYNICEYGDLDVWEWAVEAGGNSWRTDKDIGWIINPHSLYYNITTVGFGQNGLEAYAGPGHWNDLDFIMSYKNSPPHYYRISPNEQYTYMSLWAMLAAPLIYGGDMTKLDAFNLNVLCNNEIIAVNQDPLGQQAHRITLDDDGQVWAKDMEDGSKAVGLFNTTEYETKMSVKFDQLGIKGKCQVRDLWRQKDLGVFNEKFEMSVPRHGAAVIQLFPQK